MANDLWAMFYNKYYIIEVLFNLVRHNLGRNLMCELMLLMLTYDIILVDEIKEGLSKKKMAGGRQMKDFKISRT